jgi:hypothetical protein
MRRIQARPVRVANLRSWGLAPIFGPLISYHFCPIHGNRTDWYEHPAGVEEVARIKKRKDAMKNEYDVFEKFSNGSSLWRDTIPGIETTRLRLQEMAQRSKNQFCGINLRSGEVLVSNTERYAHGCHARSRTKRPSKSQAA